MIGIVNIVIQFVKLNLSVQKSKTMSKKCAYCGSSTSNITKEHVINKAFLDRFYNMGLGYANCYDKITANYLTVRDVCDVCNNEILSDYDEYFLNFYENHYTESQLKPNDTFEITYNYEKISKWILKTLYNLERKNKTNFIKPFFYNFKEYIIHDNVINNNFRIYLEVLSDVSEEEIIALKKYKPKIEIPKKLNMLKLGTQFFKNGKLEFVKYIISSNFAFYVFTDFENINNIEQKAIFYENIVGKNILFRLEPEKEKIVLKVSKRNIIDILEKSVDGKKSFYERFSQYFDSKK